MSHSSPTRTKSFRRQASLSPGTSAPRRYASSGKSGLNHQLAAAAARGDARKVKALLASRANLNSSNEMRSTPLLLAASSDHINVVRILLANRADINHQNKTQDTALILAAYYGHLRTFNELKKRGANMDLTDLMGMNALDHAKAEGRSKIIASISGIADMRRALTYSMRSNASVNEVNALKEDLNRTQVELMEVKLELQNAQVNLRANGNMEGDFAQLTSQLQDTRMELQKRDLQLENLRKSASAKIGELNTQLSTVPDAHQEVNNVRNTLRSTQVELESTAQKLLASQQLAASVQSENSAKIATYERQMEAARRQLQKMEREHALELQAKSKELESTLETQAIVMNVLESAGIKIEHLKM